MASATDLRNQPQTGAGCMQVLARYRCPSCCDRPLRVVHHPSGLRLCGSCGSSLEPRRSGLKTCALVAVGLGLMGAGVAALPIRPPSPSAGLSSGLSPGTEASLLQQLAVADRQWLPRAETLPNGSIRYHYRRRAGEPRLSVAELRALIANPPSFGSERLAIGELLSVLVAAGVRLELTQPRKSGAAGEWDPAARTLRIQPRVVSKGSLEFARVLNHEAIHVAQSCRNRGLRSSPRLLGLPTRIPGHLAGVLNEPIYRTAPEGIRQLEREAYANQDRLTLGAQLVRRHC